MGYIAGHFNSAFSYLSVSAGPTWFPIGSTENGFELVPTFHFEPVIDDAGGMAMADGIQQGQDLIIRGTSISADLITPVLYRQEPQGRFNTNVGLTLNHLAGSLVLTPVAGTPAAAMLGSGMSYVFYAAIIENDIPQLLSSKLRKFLLLGVAFRVRVNLGVLSMY